MNSVSKQASATLRTRADPPGETFARGTDQLLSERAFSDPVDRPRLDRKFEAGRHRKLTLVEAPLGYGKTTLIKAWVEKLRLRGMAVSYLSLEGTEFDPMRLLIRAIAELTREPIVPVSDHRADMRDNAVDIGSLVESFGSLQRDGTLVVDDFHNADADCNQLIQAILRHGPDKLHLVIGSRERPGFPLTKLRMSDQVTDFGIADLRFDADEASALFAGELSPAMVRSFVDRAEGWVAALHLLRQFGLQSQGPPPDFDQLSEFADYLNEQYFDRLDAEQQDLLMRTAHVARVDGDLANMLTGRSDGWAQLSKLADANALIFVDKSGDGPSYRYHQLLRDFLKSKQHLLGQAAIQKLHTRTSEWFYERNELYLAMRHACMAGSQEQAARMLLDAGGAQYGMLRGAASLAPCLDLLPNELSYQTPRLLTARAYLFLKAGRIQDAADLLNDIRAMSASMDRTLEREVILVEAHLRIYEDTSVTARQIDALEHTIASAPPTDPLMRGLLSNFLCMFLIELGDLAKARTVGESAMAYYNDIGAEHLQFFMHLHLSAIDLELGEIAAAAEKRERALQICTTHFSFDPSLRAIADIYICEIGLERGETDGLTQKLPHALARIDRHEGWNMLYLAGYETCLTLLMAEGALDDAAELLENAETMVARRGLKLFSNQLRVMELDLAIRAGAASEAGRLAGEVHVLLKNTKPDRSLRWRGRIRAELALARYEATNRQQAAALARLELLATDCGEQGQQRMRLRVLVRRFILEAEMAMAVAAAESLKTILEESSQSGALGAALREKAAFAEAARWVVTENGLGRFAPSQVSHLAEILWRASGQISGQANILAELLTAKEFEVLNELARGDANKVIARSLQITESTVKFHLQNIYGKIGVNSRKLAMEIANQNGLPNSESP